jgi:hypothetical protein
MLPSLEDDLRGAVSLKRNSIPRGNNILKGNNILEGENIKRLHLASVDVRLVLVLKARQFHLWRLQHR